MFQKKFEFFLIGLKDAEKCAENENEHKIFFEVIMIERTCTFCQKIEIF